MTESATELDIRFKRAYEPPSKADGMRVLIDRLWPRGVTKARAAIDHWFRDLAPSTELRKWFSHDPAKWPEFQRRYRAELDKHPDAWQPILDAAKRGKVTLLFSSHDAEHNNVVALTAYLEKRSNSKRKR